jgi:pilus assembly protein FimV
LDLDALLDDSHGASDSIPMSQPTVADNDGVKDFVDVDDLLTEDSDEEFVEQAFNFDAVLPPLSESNEVQEDDKGLGGKLDLALAYLEIEDFTAAKTLLDDVIQRGTAAQRSEAQTILEKLA